MAPLVTVPPCDAAAGSFSAQPCEAEVTKMSRSRRRKLRDRRVAVRHAIRSTCDLQKTSNNMFHSMLVNGLQGNSSNLLHLDGLDGVSSIFFKLDSTVQCLSETLTLLKDMYASTVSHSECALLDGALNTDAVLSYLNPLAPEFTPKSQCGADADELISGSTHLTPDANKEQTTRKFEFLPSVGTWLALPPGISQSSGQPVHGDPPSAQAQVSGLLELLGRVAVNKVTFYDSCHTVVVHMEGYDEVFDDVPRCVLRSITDKIQDLKIPSVSYLNRKLEPEARQVLRALPQSGPARIFANGPLATEATAQQEVDTFDESVAVFSISQLDGVVSFTIQDFVDRFGESLGLAVKDFEEVENIVRSSLSEVDAAEGREELYTGEQVRKLIEVVTGGCNEVVKSKRAKSETSQ